ncbi:MAG: hypothetical protein HYT88_05660 [Candidatus Omnitrophica bacterium]|nr:hypothetical protein [Candidatus Omnitrophota bacterium]
MEVAVASGHLLRHSSLAYWIPVRRRRRSLNLAAWHPQRGRVLIMLGALTSHARTP